MAGFALLFLAVELALFLKSTVPITVYVVGTVGLTAWRTRRSSPLRWYGTIRPLYVAQNVGVLAIVVTGAAGLLALDNPILNWSWWTWLASQVGDSTGGGNIIAAPLAYPWLAVPFVLLLAYTLPNLAHGEELTFRKGTKGWRDGVPRSILFGMVHCLVGVPLAVALPLSIGGLWFTRQYLQHGIDRSTTHHLTYNSIVLMAIAMLLVFT